MEGSVAGWLAGAALGVVLLVSGIAKRVDRGWPTAASALGAPSWVAAPLPWVEVVLGAVLVSGSARPFAAVLNANQKGASESFVSKCVTGGVPRKRPAACSGVSAASASSMATSGS